MNLAVHDVEQLICEQYALVRHLANAQTRCSELAQQQAAEIERLGAQVMRQRAAIIARDSALAWAREDRTVLEATIPGLPRRIVLAQRVETLLMRVQDLMRERLHGQRRPSCRHDLEATTLPANAVDESTNVDTEEEDEEAGDLEESLGSADLVICQIGCLSHGAYWRVQDHCKRTGKACVLVEQPDALRIMRIREQDQVLEVAQIKKESYF